MDERPSSAQNLSDPVRVCAKCSSALTTSKQRE